MMTSNSTQITFYFDKQCYSAEKIIIQWTTGYSFINKPIVFHKHEYIYQNLDSLNSPRATNLWRNSFIIIFLNPLLEPYNLYRTCNHSIRPENELMMEQLYHYIFGPSIRPCIFYRTQNYQIIIYPSVSKQTALIVERDNYNLWKVDTKVVSDGDAT